MRLEIITLDIADSAAQINLNANKCDSHDPLNPLQFSPDFYCFIVAVIRLHWFHLLAMHSINNLTFDAPSYTIVTSLSSSPAGGSVSVIHFDECHSSSIWMLQSTNQLWNHTNAPKLTHLCISRGKNVYNFPFAAWCRELTRRLKSNRRSNKIESEEKSRTKITTMVINCSKCFSFSLLNPLNFSVRSVPSFSSASRERSSFQSFILSCELAWNTLPILNTWIRFGSLSQFSLAKNCVPTFSSLSFKHGHIFYEHECWCCFFLIW